MTRTLRRCRTVAAGAAVAGLLSAGLIGLSATPASAEEHSPELNLVVHAVVGGIRFELIV